MSVKFLDRRTFAKGRAIFKEGEPGDAAYVLEQGQVAIVKKFEDGNKQIATLSPGSIFGEMALIDGSTRMAAAVSMNGVTCVRIPVDEFNNKMAAADPFLKALLNIFTNNLRNIQKTHIAKPRSLPDLANHLNLINVTLAALAAKAKTNETQDEIMEVIANLKDSIADITRLSKIK